MKVHALQQKPNFLIWKVSMHTFTLPTAIAFFLGRTDLQADSTRLNVSGTFYTMFIVDRKCKCPCNRQIILVSQRKSDVGAEVWLYVVLWAELRTSAMPVVPPSNCHGTWQNSRQGLAEPGRTYLIGVDQS